MTKDINPGETQQPPVVDDTQLNRVLVVVSPDLIDPSAPQESTLIDRAVALAKATGCELELFHICYDSSLLPAFFEDSDQLQREREEIVDRDATLMAELVVRLNEPGVTIHHDTRWDSPRTEAILRKIDETNPDLVMKQSREYGYIMGLMGNTDWDLIRQSPAHLWFVSEEKGSTQIERVVSAIGAGDDDELIAAEDYSVFRFANRIAESFDGVNYPVHAYQVPPSLRSLAVYAPEYGGVAHPPSDAVAANRVSSDLARKHGRAIQAFAEYFQLNLEQVRVVEGPASQVITQAAQELRANLVVMAAHQLTRWERFFRAVTAEPVLGSASCDIVFIKNVEAASIPQPEKPVVHGLPKVDLEKAVLDPQRVFSSPRRLAETEEISTAMRKRILEIWEQDVRAQMREENEGGPVQASNADILKAIDDAKALLKQIDEASSDETTELTQ